jgi:hypothetical protein
MISDLIDCVQNPGGLVHLLSAPEGSLFWAAGMRHEIQTCTLQTEIDHEYVGHCLGLLLRTGGWRLLRNVNDTPFRSFIHFCRAANPHGLGLSKKEVAMLLAD